MELELSHSSYDSRYEYLESFCLVELETLVVRANSLGMMLPLNR